MTFLCLQFDTGSETVEIALTQILCVQVKVLPSSCLLEVLTEKAGSSKKA